MSYKSFLYANFEKKGVDYFRLDTRDFTIKECWRSVPFRPSKYLIEEIKNTSLITIKELNYFLGSTYEASGGPVKVRELKFDKIGGLYSLNWGCKFINIYPFEGSFFLENTYGKIMPKDILKWNIIN